MKNDSINVYERPEVEEVNLVVESNVLQALSNESPDDPGVEIEI